MRRRITFAVVGVATGALFLAGFLTLVIDRVSSRAETKRQLTEQAEQLAEMDTSAGDRRAVLGLVRSLLRLEDATLVVFDESGEAITELPADLSGLKVDIDKLENGEVVSGTKGGVFGEGIVYAIAPLDLATPIANGEGPVGPTPGRPGSDTDSASSDSTQVAEGQATIILTSSASASRAPAALWFALSAAATLVIATVIALRLSRRITKPVVDVDGAAHRIAAGDLNVRVPDAPQSEPELASLTTSINSLAESLARAKGAERAFLMSVSHDLRTPLTSIRGYAEALSDGTTKDTANATEVIISESKRLERLVGDLLELAKLEARSFALDLRQIDANAVVNEAINGFAPGLSRENIGLRRVIGETPVAIRADSDRLGQVLANLLENAKRYAANSIEVGVRGEGQSCVIWVANDGANIAHDDLPHVFERLYRSDSQHSGSGSGLGLAIVAELVQAMGGTVEMQSPVATGQSGARAVVSFPLIESNGSTNF